MNAHLNILASLAILVLAGETPAKSATASNTEKLKTPFLALCDEACPAVREQATRLERKGHRAFYWDSYAVRALCAAYDLTGKQDPRNPLGR